MELEDNKIFSGTLDYLFKVIKPIVVVTVLGLIKLYEKI